MGHVATCHTEEVSHSFSVIACSAAVFAAKVLTSPPSRLLVEVETPSNSRLFFITAAVTACFHPDSEMSQSPGFDPFENPSDASPPSRNEGAASAVPGGLREPFVLQAVKFLSDPRVQAAEPRRAVEFLMGKNLTENEVRAAFSRLSLPFPDGKIPATDHGLFAEADPRPNVVMLPPGAQLHVGAPSRSTWSSWLWNATVIVGIIGALRELFRSYVVPYSVRELQPDSGEGDRGRRQSEQINELSEAVRELTVSSRETSQRVERLSITLSSSGALEEDVDGTCRRSGARLARSSQVGTRSFEVNSFGGDSDRSRGVLERLDDLREEVNSLKLLSSGHKIAVERSKDLPLKNVDELHTPQQPGKSLHRNLSERSPLDSCDERLSFGGYSERSRRSVSFKSDEQAISRADTGDEFMSMTPASVEKSWAGDALRSSDEKFSSDAPAAHTLCSSSEQASSALNAARESSETSSVVQEIPSDVDKTDVSNSSVRETGSDDDADRDGKKATSAASDAVSGGPDRANSALQRFRETMRAEAELVTSGEVSEAAGVDATSHADSAIGMDFGLDELGLPNKRLSTASAPAPDTALSDID